MQSNLVDDGISVEVFGQPQGALLGFVRVVRGLLHVIASHHVTDFGRMLHRYLAALALRLVTADANSSRYHVPWDSSSLHGDTRFPRHRHNCLSGLLHIATIPCSMGYCNVCLAKQLYTDLSPTGHGQTSSPGLRMTRPKSETATEILLKKTIP